MERFEGICDVCGKERGQCVETRDAGNFVLPVWVEKETARRTRQIPGDTLIRTTFKAIVPENFSFTVREVKNKLSEPSDTASRGTYPPLQCLKCGGRTWCLGNGLCEKCDPNVNGR